MAAGDVDVKITKLSARKGAYFDGVDDYVEVPHNSNQLGAQLLNGFTISAWIYAKSYGEASSGRILDKSTGGVGANGFNMRIRGANTGVSFNLNNGTLANTATGAINLGTWQHILITVSSGQLVNFYVDGVLSGNADQDTVQTIAAITTISAPRIGNRSLATDATFDGTISKVKWWNKVLSSTERATDYVGAPTATGNLIVDVPLDDYEGVTNSGSHIAIIDDAVAAVIKAQRVTATMSGAHMIAGSEGGMIISTATTETV